MSKTTRKVRSPAVWRVIDKMSPYAKDYRGSYFQVATRNMAGHFFGKPCMSFEKPYKLEPDRQIFTDKDIKKALHELHSKYILEPLK